MAKLPSELQAAADAGEFANARVAATVDNYRKAIEKLTERRWIIMQAVEAAKTLKLDKPAEFRALCDMIEQFIVAEASGRSED